MDLDDQAAIKQLVEKEGRENLVVVLGSPNPESAEITALTLTSGDPAYAGPLTGVALRLPVYHIFEPDLKEKIDTELYQEQVGLMEMALDTDQIIQAVKRVRENAILAGS